MYSLYSIAMGIFCLAYLPIVLFASLKSGKYKKSLPFRLGLCKLDHIKKDRNKSRIWIHAVSVGEVTTAVPLVKAIKSRFPDLGIVFSTVTETGFQRAHQLSMPVDHIIFFPLDFQFLAKKFIDAVSPKLFIMLETEIWPNFLFELSKRNIPAVIVNGRISESSYKRYKLVLWFMKKSLRNIKWFGMQTVLDAEKIKSLGALPERVRELGNLKYDAIFSNLNLNMKKPAEKVWKDDVEIIIWGSTHPREEEILLPTFTRITALFPDFRLIIAPRHPERTASIETLLTKHNYTCTRRTKQKKNKSLLTSEILILDTIGELIEFYKLATIIFVGGSLVPIGGHNILEAAIHKKPVFFGPHMNNFAEIKNLFLEKGAGIQVKSAEEFAEQAIFVIRDHSRFEQMAQAAFDIVQEKRGATKRAMKLIAPEIPA